MGLLTVLMRSLHTLAAAVWVGGSMIYLGVIIPALRVSPPAPEVGARIAALFRRAVNACIGVLVVSGAYLTFDRLSSGAVGTLYVVLLIAKVAAAAAMMLLAAFQAQEARRPRKYRGKLWTLAPRWILGLGLLTFALGAALTVAFDGSLGR
jgi:putative copper export protein